MGRVLGFSEKYVGRGGFNHKLAGVYIDFNRPLVSPTDGSSRMSIPYTAHDHASPFDVFDPDGYKDVEEFRKIEQVFLRIGDLQETPFGEGDFVRLNRESGRRGQEVWVVESIDRSTPPSMFGNPYKLRSTERSGSRDGDACAAKSVFDLSLVSRGNLWKMEHGEKMEFADVYAEAKFYQSLGMSQKLSRNVRIPECTEWVACRNTEEWDFTSGIEALRKGAGDQMKVKDAKRMRFVLIKYENVEFGNRMRAHELKRLGFPEEISANVA